MSRRSDRKLRPLLRLCLVAALLACQVGCGPEEVQQLAVPPGIAHRMADGMAFSPQGEMLALPRDDGRVELLDVIAGKVDVLPPAGGARAGPAAVAFSKAGRSLAVASPGRGVTIWDVATKQPGPVLALDPEIQVPSMMFLDEDRTVQSITLRRTGADPEDPWSYGVVRWDAASGERRGAEDFGRHPITATISPDGRFGVVSKDLDEMCLRDFKTGKEPCVLGPRSNAVFTADGSTLVFCDRRGGLTLWEVPSGRLRRRVAVAPSFDGETVPSLSADARLMAVGGYPRPEAAAVIRLDTGKVLAVVTCGPPLSLCRTVRLSPDGHTLATNTHAVNEKDQPIMPDLKLWRLPASW